MKKVINTLVAAITLTAVIVSCKKNDHSGFEPFKEDDLKKVQAFFDKYRPQMEKFTVKAEEGGTILLKSGTKITFKPGAFMDKNGDPVTGNVDISAKDILKASDMILDDKPTITNKGELLVSFGEIIVNAEQNGDTVRLNPKVDGRAANVAVPIGAPNGQMAEVPMWDGDTTYITTVSGFNHENEEVSMPQEVGLIKGIEWNAASGWGLANSTETNFPLNRLNNWVNCDAFYYSSNPRTTVLGYFGNKFNPLTGTNYSGKEPSMLFFKPKGQNSLIKLYNIIMLPAPGKEGLLSYQNSVPVGEEGTFLAISVLDGKFYAAQKEMAIPAPASGKNFVGIEFNLTEVSESQLINMIEQINTK